MGIYEPLRDRLPGIHEESLWAQSLTVITSSRGKGMHTNCLHHKRQDMMYTVRNIQIEYHENAE